MYTVPIFLEVLGNVRNGGCTCTKCASSLVSIPVVRFELEFRNYAMSAEFHSTHLGPINRPLVTENSNLTVPSFSSNPERTSRSTDTGTLSKSSSRSSW